jgi:hypothetical protein
VKRAIVIASLLLASQPLLVGVGVLTKWVVECGGGACAGTVYAASPFGPPRDALLTAVAVAAPYLLAVLVAAVMWLLVDQTAAEPERAAPDLQAMTRERGGEVRARPGRRWTAATTALGGLDP